MLELNFTPFPELYTERLVLRKLTLEDTEALCELRNDRHIMQYSGRPAPSSPAEIQTLIRKICGDDPEKQAICWAISLKTDPLLIGTIGYHRIDVKNHRAEMGYMLHSAHRGKGLMAESIGPVLDYGFDSMHLHSIEAQVSPENTVSSHLLKKYHFRQEGYLRENFFTNGTFTDTEIYSLVRFPQH